MLQCHGRGADDAGEADDGKALGPAKRPAVPGVDIWLRAQERDTNVITINAAVLPLNSSPAACLE